MSHVLYLFRNCFNVVKFIHSFVNSGVGLKGPFHTKIFLKKFFNVFFYYFYSFIFHWSIWYIQIQLLSYGYPAVPRVNRTVDLVSTDLRVPPLLNSYMYFKLFMEFLFHWLMYLLAGFILFYVFYLYIWISGKTNSLNFIRFYHFYITRVNSLHFSIFLAILAFPN